MNRMYCVCGAPRESNYERHDIPHSQTCAQSDPRVGMTPDPPVIEAMILEMEGEKEITRGRTEKKKNNIKGSSLLNRQAAELMLFIKWAKPS